MNLSSCTVSVFGDPRITPQAKDSRWINKRRYIENMKKSYISEMILRDGFNLFEGTVSNFFILKLDNESCCSVITAPLDYVLTGTILKLVVHVCEKYGIRFRFEFPDLRDRKSWRGAFITSFIVANCIDSYRLVNNVKCIEFVDGFFHFS